MSPLKTTVSSKLRPGACRCLLIVLAVFAMVFPASPKLSDEDEYLPCRFFVQAPQAEVLLLRSEGYRSIGLASEIRAIDLERVESDGKRELLKFKFRVPLWFDKTWESQEPEFASLAELKRSGRFPLSGTHVLSLSPWEQLQTYLSFSSFLATLLVFAVALVWLVLSVRRRRLQSSGRGLISEASFGDYEITGTLGQGGMGVVYSARSPQGERVAIKSILPALSQEADFRLRFEREVKSLKDLAHPNLTTFLGFGVDSNGNLFSVAEELQGMTLKAHLRESPFDPPALALEVVDQIGGVLTYLHSRSLVHRDVKPENIFLCRDGTLKLMDLGLVAGADLTQLTRTGHVLGTAAYMAPEQADNQPCEASDQYSLGIILYEILTGQRPFTQKRVELLVYQHKMVAPQAPSELEPRIPGAVEKVILRMLEKSPMKRFSSLEEAREALAEHLLPLSWRDQDLETIHQAPD